MKIHTGFQTVITAEACWTVAFSGVLTARSVLTARVDREITVEAEEPRESDHK